MTPNAVPQIVARASPRSVWITTARAWCALRPTDRR